MLSKHYLLWLSTDQVHCSTQAGHLPRMGHRVESLAGQREGGGEGLGERTEVANSSGDERAAPAKAETELWATGRPADKGRSGREAAGSENWGWGGDGHTVTASPAPAQEMVSDGKTFLRVEEELRWLDALRYCREHHTDLADLQSMNSVSSITALYGLTSGTQAWIGLFYNVRIGGLSWSSGSTFSTPIWSSLPIFREGFCATLYSVSLIPNLGAASCTAQKPFICYYGVFTAPVWTLSFSRGRFSQANESERAQGFPINYHLSSVGHIPQPSFLSSGPHFQESASEMGINQG